MAHFGLLWKARTIEKYRQSYENEKINSIIKSNSDVPDKTLSQRWRQYKHGMQKRLSRTFSKWYPEGSNVSNFFVSFRTDMKLPVIMLRGFYGFIGGLLMTYLGFMFFVFQLSLSLMLAIVLSSIIGVLLTLGLTFSDRMRCLILLLVPQLFSRVGRYTLTCYALVLILTGPATNTLKNSEVLSESMACSQEQIKLNVRQINESIKKPLNSIKDLMEITIERMNLVVRKLKIALIRINKLILSFASIIQSGYSWLGYMADSCNEALETPRLKCLTIMAEHYDICNKHYNFNNLKPRYAKQNNKNIRDILHALGIKNVKRQDDFDFSHEKYRNVSDFVVNAKDVNKSKNLKEHNHSGTDGGRSSTEDKIMRSEGEKSDKLAFFNAANVAETVCANLKSYEKFCVPADFATDTLLVSIRKKLKVFIRRISAIIHVQLNIQHTYNFIGNCNSSNQIAAGIVTEIRNRADPILTWLSWSSCVTSLFLLLIIFRAKHYQHMYETRSRFDNRFITKEFRELDLKRLREGRETVLPLNARERAKYVTTTSFRLVASEKLHLNRSAVFMTIATFKLLIHIVADYSLYWVLKTIQHYGKLHSLRQPYIAKTGPSISGSGFVARLLQAFIDTMYVQLSFPPPDHSCLPNPYSPDIKRYCQIGFLIFLLWFFALFEPYGLRLRHHIMGHYRPQRAKDRAVWLYNHILRTRASFMKFARRKLHRENKYSSQSKHTLRQFLLALTPIRWLRSLFGIKPDEPRCLLCNISENTSGYNRELIKCEMRGCPGTYCPGCFSDIGQFCTICLSPSDYGDFSDVSLEKGSSDEDNSNDDNDFEDYDNPGGSNKRRSINNYCSLEDANTDDGAYSKRSIFSKQSLVGHLFGRIEKKGDTLPLLQYLVRDINDEKKLKYKSNFTNKAVENIKKALNRNKKQTRINQDEHDNVTISKNLNYVYIRRITSTIDILLYSVYKITNNPLSITKFEYTTSIAKYLRRNNLIRHKKCIQVYSKYFMTCSNNKIDTIYLKTKKGGNYRDRESSGGNNLKKMKKAEKNITSNFALKDFYNKNELLKYKNEITSSNMIRHNEYKEDFHTSFLTYWNNIILTVFRNKGTMKRNENLPLTTENKRKRKKKRKKVESINKKDKKTKINKKEKVSGSSRLFAFLDERNWVNSYDNNDKVHISKEAVKGDKTTDGKIIVNNIMIPRLDLNLSSDSIINLGVQKNSNKGNSATKRKGHTNTIERFFKSIARNSCELFSLSGVKKEKDEFYYMKTNPSLTVRDPEQDLVQSKKFNASPPDSSHSTSSIKDISKEDTRRNNIVGISNPLLVVKNLCSSVFLRQSKDKMLHKRIMKPNKTYYIEHGCDSMVHNIEASVQTVRNKSIQCKTNEQGNCIKSSNIAVKYVDKILSAKQIDKCDKRIQVTSRLSQTDDKENTAFPVMTSCGCQHLSHVVQTHDFAAQVKLNRRHKKKTCKCKDANIMTCLPTCTCASQCNGKENKEVSTVVSKKSCDGLNDLKLKEESDSNHSTVGTSCDDAESKTNATVCSYVNVHDNTIRRDQRNYQTERLKCQVGQSNAQVRRSNDRVGRSNGQVERSNDQAGRSKDQALRQHYNVGKLKDQVKRLNDQFGRLKVKVVTKSNQSTLTDRTTLCDVSTATYDWWSPLVERKDILKKDRRPIENRRKDYSQPRIRERRTFRNRGMTTGEKIVTFKSKTQFIPSRETGFGDIMSPSRYLLEAVQLWNALPVSIRQAPSLAVFKEHVIKLYLSQLPSR